MIVGCLADSLSASLSEGLRIRYGNTFVIHADPMYRDAARTSLLERGGANCVRLGMARLAWISWSARVRSMRFAWTEPAVPVGAASETAVYETDTADLDAQPAIFRTFEAVK